MRTYILYICINECHRGAKTDDGSHTEGRISLVGPGFGGRGSGSGSWVLGEVMGQNATDCTVSTSLRERGKGGRMEGRDGYLFLQLHYGCSLPHSSSTSHFTSPHAQWPDICTRRALSNQNAYVILLHSHRGYKDSEPFII